MKYWATKNPKEKVPSTVCISKQTEHNPHMHVVFYRSNHKIWTEGVTVPTAMGLLSPVDCAYTLVFTRGKGEDVEVLPLNITPAGIETMRGFLLKEEALRYFAHYETVELTGLRAIIPEPTGPHCRIQGNFLRIHRGDEQWIWMKTERIYLGGDLSTTDLAAICNPHKCNVRIKAVGPNAHKVTYFTAGKAMTPGDLLEYEYLELIGAEPEEN